MCSCDDFDVPSFYVATWVRARKQHRCYGCGVGIQRGARYQRCSGKWDGDISSYAVCALCDALCAGFDAVKDEPHCYPGATAVRECLREEAREVGFEGVRFSGARADFWRRVHAAARAQLRRVAA